MSRLQLVPTREDSDGTSQVTANQACLDAFRQQLDYLSRALRRLGVQSADVEDLAHEVFLVLHRHWDEYDQARPFRPYLFGIVFRVASVYHRQTRRTLPYALPDAEDEVLRPDQALESKQARALALRALESIPLPRRAVFVMHAIDEVNMHEVASVLGIPLFTAYSRLRKARKEFEAEVVKLLERSDP